MIYSEKYKYIFFCIPKCASMTIASILIRHFSGKKFNDMHDCYVPEQFKNFFKFATVRNPHNRAISGWKYLKKVMVKPTWYHFHLVSMKTFLSNEVRATGSVSKSSLFKRFQTKKPGPKIDKFLRVEKLEDDFRKLPFVENSISLPVVNKSSTQLSVSEIGKIHEYVNSNYQEDFKLWRGADGYYQKEGLPFVKYL